MASNSHDHTNRMAPMPDWCEDRATTIGHDVDDEEYEITHLCRFHEGHPAPHQCWMCSQTWEMEVPC